MTITRKELESGTIDFSDVIDVNAMASVPTSPGAILRSEWLTPMKISPYRLAKDIDVPPNRVTGILSGERVITADTALRLAEYFDTDAQSWMNLQTRYDLAIAKMANGAEIRQAVKRREAA